MDIDRLIKMITKRANLYVFFGNESFPESFSSLCDKLLLKTLSHFHRPSPQF